MAPLSLAVFAAALAAAPPPLPETLAQTGLYVDAAMRHVASEARPYSPQYPLWSDGARKQRWLRLPAGTAIDASDPSAWEFPPGTKLWKQFSHGRALETRYIERLADGSWRFATYLWNAEGTDARLAPEFGATLAVEDAPGGRYAVPSRGDCLACHDTAGTPVLGVSALQLSSDRDPLAPHAEASSGHDLDVDTMQHDGLLANWQGGKPRIDARSPQERAVLGYFHGNCGHCHAAGDASAAAVPVDLALAWRPDAPRAALDSLLAGRPRMAGTHAGYVRAGDAEASLVAQRMRSRDPFTRMPPLGSGVPDDDALALIGRWIDTLRSCKMKTRNTADLLVAAALALACAAPLHAEEPTPLVQRGNYLVDTLGCHDCHTPFVMTEQGPSKDMAHALSGHPESLVMPEAPVLPEGPWQAVASGTFTAWNGPWGTSFTANLTPDPETGLGKWTYENFRDTIRTGRHLGRGRQVLPPMPIPAYGHLTDDDLRAVFAYLQTVPAVKNRVPEPRPPAQPAAAH